MKSSWGGAVRLEIEGGSHDAYMTMTLTGIPAGEAVDLQELNAQMARRAPGRDASSTARREPDVPVFMSGLRDGKTDGAPIRLTIENQNARSQAYQEVGRLPRPSHADYPAILKYGEGCDLRGGGHFSGRLTAPLVAAGAVARQVLARRGVVLGGHVLQIGPVKDAAFDPVAVDADLLLELSAQYFATLSSQAQQAMRQTIEQARLDGDSVGGAVELAAVGLPAGLGTHMFDGLENRLSSILFGVPAVKAVAFGDGFDFAAQLGSQANDEWYYDGAGNVKTYANHCGGVVGGMATGMPLLVRAALKPTPSIAKPQRTIDLLEKKNAALAIEGRHDPCIVPRALPALEAALAVGLLDVMAQEKRL